MSGIGVFGRNDHPADAMTQNGAGAGWRPTCGAAGFEGHIKGGPLEPIALSQGVLDGPHLGMSLTCPFMPAFAQDLLTSHQHRTYHGIG